jgi:hypothetical protein
VLLLIFIFLVAIFVENVAALSSVTGNSVGIGLTFVIPILAYNQKIAKSIWIIIFNYSLMVILVIFGIVGVY